MARRHSSVRIHVFTQMHDRLCGDHMGRGRRIDHAETSRLGCRAGQEGGTDTFEKLVVLALDAIWLEVTIAGTVATMLDAKIQQQRQPWLDADNPLLQRG